MEAIPLRSYDLDAFDADQELARLERQATVASNVELDYLRELIPGPDATIIDVGCGPGFVTRRLAALVPRGRVIGVEPDRRLVERARASADAEGLTNVRFVEAWAEKLPVQSDYADLVYARFLFQHVPEPREVLRELVRVLVPGGAVVAVDSDDGSMLVFPPVPELDRLLEASHDSQALLGGDRHIGRKLRSLMCESGLGDLHVDVVPFTTEQVGFDAFVDLAVSYKAQLVDPERMPREAVDRVVRRFRALDEDPGAYAQTLVYVVRGHHLPPASTEEG